jgi:hypothetical protein
LPHFVILRDLSWGDEGKYSKEAVTFLKKSNQKTFVLRARALERAKPNPRHREQKFFAALFLKKPTSSFSSQQP